MGGPSGHGQKNKPHKAGRNAGLSAREKARKGKEVQGHRPHPKQTSAQGKLERHLAAKQNRDAKRQELLQKKRSVGPPLVIALLPLSSTVDVPRLWHGLRAACAAPQGSASASGPGSESTAGKGSETGGMDVETTDMLDAEVLLAAGSALEPCTVSVGGRSRCRVTLLPPPTSRNDPLAVVDIARAADIILLAVPSDSSQSSSASASAAGGDASTPVIDAEGEMALTVLRTIGLPGVVCCVANSVVAVGGSGGTAANVSALQKERSAAKKRAEKALAAKLAGEHKVLNAHTPTDLSALARHLSEQQQHPSGLQHWRMERAQVLVERTEILPESNDQQQDAAGAGPSSTAAAAAAGSGGNVCLRLSGFVRCAGFSANQVMHVPGAGDFQISAIYGPADPHLSDHTHNSGRGGAVAMDAELTDPSALMPLVARPDPEDQDTLVRENQPDPMDGEQTWPTEQELEEAERMNAGASGSSMFEAAKRRKRVPAGTSDYQAAWILDSDDDDDDDDDGSDQDDDGDYGMMVDDGAAGGSTRRGNDAGGADDEDAPELEPLDMDDAGTDAGDMDMGDDDEGREAYEAQYRAAKANRYSADDEAAQREYPDEVEAPVDMAARVRFQKYRGLKSLRSSPWDPKESLPQEYARVFAFENFKRAQKRARESVARATAGLDPCSVMRGTWVVVELAGVPAAAAQRVAERVSAFMRGEAPALVAFGLMTHETKMSVANFAVRKAATYTPPVANKQELLFVTGLRTFLARPILSTDDPGRDKHKMERFLQPGHQCIATVFAPISYPPLPLLAFAPPPPDSMGGVPQLAAVGALRSCDPDRIVLKKIVLTGLPVRVHKRRATVKYMFHNPDDVRWFKPVEVYTKAGRRGRITEPLGTHGAMKCFFDQPLQQRDTICMALYKRVFPKWPADLTFA